MGAFLPPQGFFWWPGIVTFLHGSFTFAHGINPSLCQLYIAPQLDWPAMAGELTVNYLPGGNSYTFSDCLLDFVSVEREPDGRQVWGLHILDRRWKWKDCGRISGNYNIRWQNGDGDEEIFTPSLRTLQELMELCLDAMGEDVYGYDVAAVVEETYPQVEWDYENPARALLELCDKYGYRVILTLENQVLVAKANEGNYLPDGTYLSGATTINPPNTPSSIVVAAGHTLAQYDFPLVPMAKELDNTYVPLDEVSYKPDKPHGWGDVDLPDFFQIEDPVAREYARTSVWKAFQIGVPFTMEGIDEENPENDEIEDVMRVLPLLDHQLVKAPQQLQPTSDDSDTENYQPGQPLPAVVYGIYWTYEGLENSQTEIDSSQPMQTAEQGKYMGNFQIEGERGLVIFDDYTCAYSQQDDTDEDAKYIVQPTLYLRTACNVRDAETLGFLRAEVKQDLESAQLATLPMYVKSDDVALKITYSFEGWGEVAGSEDNWQEVESQAQYVAESTLAKMLIEDQQSFEYPGLVFIELDGAIQQITWNVGEDGKATTECNRCKEDLVNTQSYEEAKQQALLQKALQDREKLGRIIKQDASQALTVSGK
jgi:hypothetical protein